MATEQEIKEMQSELNDVELQRVREKIKEIRDLHEIDNSGMCGPDPLNELETEAEFRKLLDSLSEYKYLSEKRVGLLTDEIKSEIKRLYFVTIEKLMNKKVKTEEDVLELLEEISVAHVNGSKTLLQYGTRKPLDYVTALKCYKSLLFYLEDMEELSSEQKIKLATLIEEKISGLKKVESEKLDAYIASSKEKDKEFDAAKERFNSLSFFKKMKLKMTKQSPEYQEVNKMDVESIKKLYR